MAQSYASIRGSRFRRGTIVRETITTTKENRKEQPNPSNTNRERGFFFQISKTSKALRRHTGHITLVSLSHGFHYVRLTPKQHVIMQCNYVAALFMHDGYDVCDQVFNVLIFI